MLTTGVLPAMGVQPVVVALFDGDTGDVRWTRRIDGSGPGWAALSTIMSMPDGDVVAGGLLRDAAGLGQFTVFRLAGSNGAERWRTVVPSEATGANPPAGGIAVSLALTPDGKVAAGGTTQHLGTCGDVTVAEIEPGSGRTYRVRRIDGTAQASTCVRPDCDRPPCGQPKAGIDADYLYAIGTSPHGGLVVTGEVCDGPRGRTRGLLAELALD